MTEAVPNVAIATLNPELSAVLRGLLADALSTLAQDPSGAGRSIRRAADLLARGAEISDPIAAGGLAPWQCKLVEAHIAANLDGRLSRQLLAGLVRLSGSHFARAFKASFGCAPHAYLVARRVAHAKDLLRTTGLPLCEIALICGMADQAHFSSVFRRSAGQSPSAWRRRHRAPPPSPRTPPGDGTRPATAP
jgi:AraC family transcriptional regulator